MLRLLTAVSMVLLIGCGAAFGGPTFFATQGRTLFRTDGVTSASFTLSDDITGMATAPDGTIWASSRSDDDHDGFYELYKLTDPMGPAPTLTLWDDFLAELTPTLWVIDGTLYGYQHVDGQSLANGQMVKIDYISRSQARVGNTGAIGVPSAGAAYDPVHDVLYAIAGRPDAALYTVDYHLNGGPDPSATEVGPLGVEMRNHGAEFFDGKLYAAVQDPTGPLKLGWVDTGTGQFNFMFNLAGPSSRAVGLAVLPEPAALTLLGLGLAWVGRRRRH